MIPVLSEPSVFPAADGDWVVVMKTVVVLAVDSMVGAGAVGAGAIEGGVVVSGASLRPWRESEGTRNGQFMDWEITQALKSYGR